LEGGGEAERGGGGGGGCDGFRWGGRGGFGGGLGGGGEEDGEVDEEGLMRFHNGEWGRIFLVERCCVLVIIFLESGRTRKGILVQFYCSAC